jgi:hypothetical protein
VASTVTKLEHVMIERTQPVVSPTVDATLEPIAEVARVLTPEAQRALAEADARRQARDAALQARPGEIGGRAGPDPVRYGDWEQGGIAWDF